MRRSMPVGLCGCPALLCRRERSCAVNAHSDPRQSTMTQWLTPIWPIARKRLRHGYPGLQAIRGGKVTGTTRSDLAESGNIRAAMVESVT